MAAIGLKQLTFPTTAVISRADLKSWARIDTTADDTLVDALTLDAQEYIEDETSRCIVAKQFVYTMDSFPPFDASIWLIRQPRPYLPQTRNFQGSGGGTIRPPRSPLVSVDSLTYVDSNGVTQTLDPSMYIVDTYTVPGRLVPSYGNVWPTTRWQVAAVQTTFTAGYTTQALPRQAVRAVAALAAHWYENREATIPVSLRTVPFALKEMIAHVWSGEYR